MKKKLIISGIVALAVVVGLMLSNRLTLGGGAGQTARGCTVSTEAIATVGGDLSTTVLAAHSGRAWARIQQPVNATNTVFLSFNAGTAATTNTGLILGDGNGTTTITSIDFGRNTDFPYTGAVTGIANIATTSVFVTECRY